MTPASVQAAVVIPTMVVSALINPDRANPEATEYRALIDERTPGAESECERPHDLGEPISL